MKKVFRHLRLLVLLSVLLAVGCIPQAQKFTVVASGASLEGPELAQPRFLVFRSGDSYQTLVADLPGEASEALRRALEDSRQGLYILVYPGPQPTSGYSVEVTGISHSVLNGRQQLSVRWRLQKPGPDQLTADVITHPWVIVRLEFKGTTRPDVRFTQVNG